MIPVFRPQTFSKPERLIQTLVSSWWGTGPATEEFEGKFAAFVSGGLDKSYAVPPDRCLFVNSCTAALHLAVLAYPDSKRVLVPAITFISTGLAPLYCGKKVVMVDVGDDLCIDQTDALNKLESERDMVIAVHMGGHVADLHRLRDNCRIIEDCAHALGSIDNCAHVGIEEAGCFSFQATKVLPIGDGGMFIMPPEISRRRMEALAWCGIEESTWKRTDGGYRWQYPVTEVGYKYRGNDLWAALALDQWEGLGVALQEKRRIADRYTHAFRDLSWLTLPRGREGTLPNWQEYIVRCARRDDLCRHLGERGIASTVHYWPINRYMPFVEHIEGGFGSYSTPNADRLAAEILTIPSFVGMTEWMVEQVVNGVRSFPA